MVANCILKPPPVPQVLKAPVKQTMQNAARVRHKVPAYKKSEKIIENILKFEDNPRHIFRLKTLDRIYQEIAKEVLQGQTLLPFDGMVLKRDGLNIYLNIYKKEECEWLDKKNENYKKFMGNDFIIVQTEIEGTETLPLKGSILKRVKMHIELLRALRQGIKVKKAVRIAKRKIK